MPRRKLHTSKDAIKIANRAKSAKYYQNIERMRRKRIKKWEDDQMDLRGPVDNCDPLSRIKLLNHSLIRITKSKPSQYLETVYNDYAKACRAPKSTPQLCPVENATTAINALLRGADVFANRILQSNGVTEHYRRANKFSQRLRWIIRCLEDMQYKFMDPDDDLEQAYAEKRLSFQHTETKDWIDGLVPIPD
ncbi:hypothetical protein VNI00_018676 [Paramarasmius palmivorus]|uniref:Uncharacterized protein n=1 Tax=Paramarasmius palmivorus TaxID=297713 RepID=A0AAW0AX16_9AGAR